MGSAFAFNIVRQIKEQGHSLCQSQPLPSETAKRCVASKHQDCIRPFVIDVLESIEIGVDAR
jgi:hypothetical protein